MMRRGFVFGAVLVTSILAGVWLRAQQMDSRPLAQVVPSGAILYLEARDFHSLLEEWNQSGEKARWVTGENYQAMKNSRLIQRVGEARSEFVSVAGVPIGMNLLNQMAGSRSALAFYDVSYDLSFVYLTQIPQSRLEASELWHGRSKYQTREVDGVPFYVKSGSGSEGSKARTVAFASYQGWMVLAADESLMARTLKLLAGREASALSGDAWYREANAAEQPGEGDLRLAYNAPALIATPQFRTYWVQHNASTLKQFSSGLSVLRERPYGFEERRVLVRKSPANTVDASDLAAAVQFAPGTSSLYRAWAGPGEEQMREVVQQVLFGEHLSHQDFNAPAPVVSTEAGEVGSESDLEIRIDEPPMIHEHTESVQPVLDALRTMQPSALLHVQATTVLQDRVFVYPSSGLVLICKRPDEALLRSAVSKLNSRLVSDDLDPLTISVDGNAVILSRLQLKREAAATSVPSGTTSVAVYNHAFEWRHYNRLFALIGLGGSGAQGQFTPSFFSSDLESLGNALPRLRSASILSADDGAKIEETVSYSMAPK